MRKEMTDRPDSAQITEQQFHEMFQSAPDATIVVDSDGTIVLVNAQTQPMFGYTAQELIGKPIELLLPERLRGNHVQHRARYFSDRGVRWMGRGLELSGLTKDNTEIPVDVGLSPLAGEDGPLAVCAIRDISYLKQAEQKIKDQAEVLARTNENLELINKELDDLGGILAHDLLAPLRHLNRFSDLLLEDAGEVLTDQNKQYLGFIQNAAIHMENLISELLAFARAGNKEINKQPVALASSVQEVMVFFSAAIEKAGARIIIDDLPEVQADPQMLKQVIQNLIGNALKFVGEAPPLIHITVEHGENETVIGVKDNGLGIQSQYQEQVFAPFKRAPRSGNYEGSGIGLATCKKVIERHGGRIWVESAPGEGAHFKFALPRT